MAYVYGGGLNVGYSLASRMRVVAIAHDIVGGSGVSVESELMH